MQNARTEDGSLFTIRSKKEQSKLICLLKEEGLSYVLKDNQSIDIHVTTEEEKEALFFVLGFHIAYPLFKEKVLKRLETNSRSKDFKDEVYNHSCDYYVSSRYWTQMAILQLRSFFDKQNNLSIESFARFNLPGFEKEVFEFVDELIVELLVEKGELSSDSLTEDDLCVFEDDIESSLSFKALLDSFKALKEEGQLSGVNGNSLHLCSSGEGYDIFSENWIKLDDQFFMEEFGARFTVEGGDEMVVNSIFLTACLYIFSSNRVLVHQGFSPKNEEVLRQHLISFQEENPKLMFARCSGCQVCEQHE